MNVPFRTLLVSLLALLLLPACQSGGGGQVAEDGLPVPGGYARTQPEVPAALDDLPPDVAVVAYAADPMALADQFGRRALAEAAGELYAEAGREVVEIVGVNLMEPEELESAGIDPHGPAGLFAFGTRVNADGGFVTIADDEAFVGFLRESSPYLIGRGTLQVQEFAGGQLAFAKGGSEDACLLLHEGTAFFIDTYGTGSNARRLARELAGRASGEGLADAPAFRAAHQKLGFGTRATGFINVQTVMGDLRAAAQRERPSYMLEHLQRKLTEARKDGRDETAQRLEEKVEQERARVERERQRRLAWLDLVESRWGAIPGISLGLEVEGPAIRLKAYVPSGGEASELGSLLGEDRQPHALLGALEEQPLLAAGLKLDVAAVIDLLETVVEEPESDEEAFDRMLSRVSERFGVDLQAEVIERLTGEVGVFVDGDFWSLVEAGPADADDLRGGLAVGIRQSEALADTIDSLIEQLGMSRLVESTDQSGGWTIRGPDSLTLHLNVRGGYLSLSTDSAWHGQLKSADRAGDEGRGLHILGLRRSPILYESQVGLMAVGMTSYLVTASDEPARIVDQRKGEPADTLAYRETKKKLAEIEENLSDLRDARREAARKAVRRYIELLGATSMAVRREGEAEGEAGLTLYVQKTVGAEDVPSATRRAAEAWQAHRARRRELHEKIDALYERRRELRQQLRELLREGAD